MTQTTKLAALGGLLTALFAAHMTGTAVAEPTKYPLEIENCGQTVVFDKAPERTVALGQNTAEILFMLGLDCSLLSPYLTKSLLILEFLHVV